MSDGLPIVWVPGHLCGPWLYAQQLPRFGEAHPTVIADTVSDDSIRAMAERLIETAPARFVLVGLSMGGMVAMEAMARAPDRVAGAVLLDTDPTAAREKEIAWRGRLLAKTEAKGLTPYIDALVPKFFGHDAEVSARFDEMVRGLAADVPVSVARRQARALDTRRDILPALTGFEAPVEVIAGAEDRICPARLHPPIAAACGSAELTILDGVGHLATLEAPEMVSERIAQLLDRVAAAEG